MTVAFPRFIECRSSIVGIGCQDFEAVLKISIGLRQLFFALVKAIVILIALKQLTDWAVCHLV